MKRLASSDEVEDVGLTIPTDVETLQTPSKIVSKTNRLLQRRLLKTTKPRMSLSKLNNLWPSIA